jgi:hypothetical protein
MVGVKESIAAGRNTVTRQIVRSTKSQGGPVLCTLEPNHDIGGPLQPGASLGNTGVFINGRELHYLDIALLQRVVPMIIPGCWWLDVYGNFGSEGGPMLGNIWTLAQSQGASGTENRSSVLSSWDRTGVALLRFSIISARFW